MFLLTISKTKASTISAAKKESERLSQKYLCRCYDTCGRLPSSMKWTSRLTISWNGWLIKYFIKCTWFSHCAIHFMKWTKLCMKISLLFKKYSFQNINNFVLTTNSGIIVFCHFLIVIWKLRLLAEILIAFSPGEFHPKDLISTIKICWARWFNDKQNIHWLLFILGNLKAKLNQQI